MRNFIPYGRHSISKEDIEAVIEVLKSDWLTCGPIIDQFEQALSEVTGAQYAISCSNGTTALHMAMLALDIKEEDWVIVPSITFLASANAVRYMNANVIFADVDPNTGLVTPDMLEQAILNFSKKSKIKAFINVHFAGQCENLEAIFNICEKYGLFIIEDAAHAIGTNYIDSNGKSHPIGSCNFCEITTFSFHPVKTMTMGEGGAITTNSTKLAEKAKQFRSHAMIRDSKNWLNLESGLDEKSHVPNPWYYEMHELGYNYRIPDINCALGLSQLTKIKEFKTKRTQMVAQYDEAFNESLFLKPLTKLKNSDSAWHLYVTLLDFEKIGLSRAEVMLQLKNVGIGSQVHYIPVYRQPYYEKLYGKIRLDGAEKFYQKCLSIPLFIGLNNADIGHVINSLKSL